MKKLSSILTRGIILPLITIGVMEFISGCILDPNSGKEQSPNSLPNTSISKFFQDDGKIKYTFSGNDSDGSIRKIEYRVNYGSFKSVVNNSVRVFDIVKGRNSIEAIAYDEEGAKDLTPARYSFDSPTNDVAVEKIESILEANSSKFDSYEKRKKIAMGSWRDFHVDFLVVKKDGTDTILHYVSHNNNLANELLIKEELDLYGIPNLYLVRLPLNEINSRVKSFISRGFN